MLKSMIHPLEREFNFAGFSWPRYVAELPRGTMAARLEEARNPVCGPYYHAPTPNNRKGIGFYLTDASGAPFGLRWAWADECEGACIRNTGWRCDAFGDQTIRGLVFRLPHGRGFLAGWSMGENMASSLDYYIYQEEGDAARAADSMAESAADDEREYQETQNGEDE